MVCDGALDLGGGGVFIGCEGGGYPVHGQWAISKEVLYGDDKQQSIPTDSSATAGGTSHS